MSIKNRSKKIILITLALIICGVVVFFEGPSFSKIINNEVEYNSIAENNFLEDKNNNLEKEKTEIKEEEKKRRSFACTNYPHRDTRCS